VTAEKVAQALQVPLPITDRQIIRYSMGKPLNFDPGTAYAYSNFGYCVLGRVIEEISGRGYQEFVRKEVLAPAGIREMRLGKNLLADRAAGEVKYYDSGGRTGRAISGPKTGERAPLPYGVECIETMDANGGWIASAVDLMRFAVALEEPKKCPILKEASIEAMLAPPPGPVGHEADGQPKRAYYACGWNVRTGGGRGKCAKSHAGLLAGSSTMLACGDDGINWTALFNCDADRRAREFAGMVGGVMRQALAEVKEWPAEDLFGSEK
jgi:N-acyl-D-amino-acid deacylase